MLSAEMPSDTLAKFFCCTKRAVAFSLVAVPVTVTASKAVASASDRGTVKDCTWPALTATSESVLFL